MALALGAGMDQPTRATRWWAVQCDPPLQLPDGRAIVGLTKSEYDHLQTVIWKYYRSTRGILDDLPTGVGRGTDYNRVNSKRHKPESQPPPRASDLDEPDWHIARLAVAIEVLTPTEQFLIRMKVADPVTMRRELTIQEIADRLGKSEWWVVTRWGQLATRLYCRERGLCD